MDFRAVLASNFKLQNLVFIGLNVLLIAIVFEVIAWWAARRIEKLTMPLIPGDSGREASWRVRRRTLLRHTPKIISRSLCYTIAIILVFNAFGVEVLPLSIAVGAIIALFGAALLPMLRDIAQGYALLAEDALAPGDLVEINGHIGTVEKFTLRGVWLRDSDGRAHCLSNRNIADVIAVQRRVESAPSNEFPPDTKKRQ